MRIEKSECNYQVTECDLKFGEQITLDGELLIPISVLDNIRAEIQEERKVENIPEDVEMWDYIRALDRTLSIIDKYRAESEEKEC